MCVGAGVDGCVAGSAAADLNGADRWSAPWPPFHWALPLNAHQSPAKPSV